MYEAHTSEHAAFGPVFAALQTTPRLTAYRAALRQHDWEFNFSDDGRVYDAGRLSLARLMLEAAVIDPDHAVWNSIAPVGHRRGAA